MVDSWLNISAKLTLKIAYLLQKLQDIYIWKFGAIWYNKYDNSYRQA